MTRAEYDALEGRNFSTLKHILRSPSHYQAELNDEETEEDKLRFAVGSLSHAMTLEGKDLRSLYAIKPAGMSFATKEGKAWRAEQTLPILDSDSALKIPLMAEAVVRHPLARAILELCPHREVALQAEIDGVLCKGMLDSLGRDRGGNVVYPDYKTTTDARAFKFKRKVEFEQHYDLQNALYRALCRECDKGDAEPLWIVQETSAPYAVMVYQPGADLRKSGEDKLRQVLSVWQECTASGDWYGYQKVPVIQEL